MEASRAPDGPRRALLALGRVRARLRRLRLLDGLLLLLLATAGGVAASFILDATLDLPQAVRAVFLVSGAVAAGYLAWRRVVRPLGQRVADEDLALLVEESHPELRQSLITAVQLSRTSSESARWVSPGLVRSVVEDVESRIDRLPLDRVFRRRRLVRNGLGLLALVVLLGVGATRSPELAGIWLRRNLLLAAERWPQDTLLEAPELPDTVAIGDDLRVEVRLLRGDPRVVHVVRETERGDQRPRPMDRKPKASWDLLLEKAPPDLDAAKAALAERGHLDPQARETLEAGRGRLASRLSPGASQALREALVEAGAAVRAEARDLFAYEFSNVSPPLRFRIEGGDARLGPYSVDVRMRPRIDMSSIRIRYRLPEYTGSSGELLEQEHGNLKVPVGTEVRFTMRTNIPVTRAFLVLSEEAASVRGGSRTGDASEAAEGADAADGAGAEPWPDPGAVALDIEEGREFSGRFVVAGSGEYWFQFEDTTGFRSGQPDPFRIQAVPDRKPDVRIVEPERVTEEVSTEARIPVAVTVRDDHGIRRVVLEGGYFPPGRNERVSQTFPLPLRSAEDGSGGASVEAGTGPAPDRVETEMVLRVSELETGGTGAPVPGARFEFYALAEDSGDTGERHDDGTPVGHVGESRVHALEVVDKDTLRQVLAGQLMMVRDQLRQLLGRQEAIRENLDAFLEESLLRGEIDSEAAGRLARPRREQRKVREGLEVQSDDVGRIIRKMEQNAIGDDRWKGWVGRIREEITRLASEDVPGVEEALESLRSDASQAPQEPSRVSEITYSQRRVERRLRSLILRLEEFGDQNALLQILRDVRRRQAMIRDATREQVGGRPGTDAGGDPGKDTR